MAAAGAGPGPSPAAALGGQEVTQGHSGFSTARGMTRGDIAERGQRPMAPGTGLPQEHGPAAPRAAEGAQRSLSGCRGPRSTGPSSARRARGIPGAPAGLGPGRAAGEPGGFAPLGSAAGLGRGGSCAPGELKIPKRRRVSAHRAAPTDLERGRLRGRRWRPNTPATSLSPPHPARGWHTGGGHTCAVGARGDSHL